MGSSKIRTRLSQKYCTYPHLPQGKLLGILMSNYFLLSFLILGVMCTFFMGGLLVMALFEENECEDDIHRSMRKKWVFWSGLFFIVFAALSYQIYQYLAFHAVHLLVNFAWWYLTGFVSRIPLLVHNGSLFQSTFSTDWDEVFQTFFTALLGPFQIFFTLRGIWKYKHWS